VGTTLVSKTFLSFFNLETKASVQAATDVPAGLDNAGEDGVPIPGQDAHQVNDLAGNAQLFLGQCGHLPQHVHLHTYEATFYTWQNIAY
jgi:hypothetical protein